MVTTALISLKLQKADKRVCCVIFFSEIPPFIQNGSPEWVGLCFGVPRFVRFYKEALAEQRQLTSGLLGTNQRPKPKEKKQKKAGKKVKERIWTSASNDTPSLSPSKSHVEFEEPPVVDSATTNNKKRTKKDKMKPILLNKEKMPLLDGVDVDKQTPTNHFEQIHPKDDFELLLLHNED
ncbi:hypothetical protein CBL_08594 [Carabus blaptoides fortunei]